MPRIKEPWGRLLLLALTFLCIFLYFNEYFRTPNKVIEPYGDGFKAYTVIWYHAKYDSTYTHFEGMNYPYGDHVVPGATQPIVSNTIKFVSRNLVDIADYTVAIINFSMLLGILLCSFFLYLIFRLLELPVWYSIPAAIGITFLSPQIHRMVAHYGLAHLETLPLLIYLLMRFEKRPHLGASLLIGIFLTFYSLIHFYYLALLGSLISCYFLFSFLYRLRWNKLPRYALHYSLQVVVPAGGLFWWINSTDIIPDRDQFPWGFFHYRAFLEGVFTSLSQPYFRWINDHIIKFRWLDYESLSYIGLVAAFVFLFLVVRWVRQRFQVLPVAIKGNYKVFLNKMFFSALVILLFALGLPFIIPGLEGLLDFAGPIRQFRSIGRFAWIFYFVMNIIAFTWIYQQAEKNHTWRPLIIGVPLLVLAFEAYFFNKSFSLALDEVRELQPGEQFTNLQIDYDDYQAIHTVPYYNIGSGNFWWEPEGFILQKSLTLSVQTGLPVTSAMLTRSSLSHTLNLLQLATPPYRPPRILHDFPDHRPLLLAWDKREFEKERERYEHFLSGTELLYEGERLVLYKLPLSSFEERIERRRSDILREAKADSILHRQGNFLSTDSLRNFVFRSMDSLASGQPYRGEGGFSGPGRELNILYEGPLPRMAADSQYYCSVWIDLGEPLRARTDLELVEYMPDDGRWLQHQRQAARRLVQVMDTGGWTLIRLPFKRQEAASHFRVTVQNPDMSRDESLFLDELLLCPRSTSLYQLSDTAVWKNNLYFPVR